MRFKHLTAIVSHLLFQVGQNSVCQSWLCAFWADTKGRITNPADPWRMELDLLGFLYWKDLLFVKLFIAAFLGMTQGSSQVYCQNSAKNIFLLLILEKAAPPQFCFNPVFVFFAISMKAKQKTLLLLLKIGLKLDLAKNICASELFHFLQSITRVFRERHSTTGLLPFFRHCCKHTYLRLVGWLVGWMAISLPRREL